MLSKLHPQRRRRRRRRQRLQLFGHRLLLLGSARLASTRWIVCPISFSFQMLVGIWRVQFANRVERNLIPNPSTCPNPNPNPSPKRAIRPRKTNSKYFQSVLWYVRRTCAEGEGTETATRARSDKPGSGARYPHSARPIGLARALPVPLEVVYRRCCLSS